MFVRSGLPIQSITPITMQATVSRLYSNPLAIGLAAGATAYLLIDHFKPSLIYKDDKFTLQNDMVSPLTVGAVVAAAVGVYWNKSRSYGGGLMGSGDFSPLAL